MQQFWNDSNGDRLRTAYLDEFPQYYSAGDAGTVDANGYLSIMARTDDVINCAGHRLSTGQMEEVLFLHPRVAECAVVGAADNLRGQVPVGLLVLNEYTSDPNVDDGAEKVVAEVIALMRNTLGPVASFNHAAVVDSLPKTRSGKILRGVIQKIADGEAYVLPGTIEDKGPVDLAIDALRSLGYPPLYPSTPAAKEET